MYKNWIRLNKSSHFSFLFFFLQPVVSPFYICRVASKKTKSKKKEHIVKQQILVFCSQIIKSTFILWLQRSKKSYKDSIKIVLIISLFKGRSTIWNYDIFYSHTCVFHFPRCILVFCFLMQWKKIVLKKYSCMPCLAPSIRRRFCLQEILDRLSLKFYTIS